MKISNFNVDCDLLISGGGEGGLCLAMRTSKCDESNYEKLTEQYQKSISASWGTYYKTNKPKEITVAVIDTGCLPPEKFSQCSSDVIMHDKMYNTIPPNVQYGNYFDNGDPQNRKKCMALE